jgi:RNA recognition motif-containing protein
VRSWRWAGFSSASGSVQLLGSWVCVEEETAGVEYRCFVGGLAWATSDDSLHAAFSPFGEVLEPKVHCCVANNLLLCQIPPGARRSDLFFAVQRVQIINDRETGRSRGFGFVTFANEQSMRDAIEQMNGKQLDDRNITVKEAQSRGGRAAMAATAEAAVVATALGCNTTLLGDGQR